MLTHERLLNFLIYDPDEGHFTWRRSKGRQCAGQRAGVAMVNGYRSIVLDGKRYYEHRLAWFYVTKQWPVHGTDHMDRNPKNNRFTNLRQATFSQNGMNMSIGTLNTSGVKGVYWSGDRQKWVAQIKIYGKVKLLGRFLTKDEAIGSRLRAEAFLFGEYSNQALAA